MKPTIGSRSESIRANQVKEKPITPTQHYVKVYTRINIVEKCQFLYLDDVKTAILN